MTYIFGAVLKSNLKIVESGKIDTTAHKCMTPHFPGLARALQKKVAGLKQFYGPKSHKCIVKDMCQNIDGYTQGSVVFRTFTTINVRQTEGVNKNEH